MAVTKRGKGFQVDFMYRGVRCHPPVFYDADDAIEWETRAREAIRSNESLPPVPKQPRPGEPTKGSIGAALERAIGQHWQYRRGSHRTVLNARAFVAWVGPLEKATVALSEETLHSFLKYLLDERRVSGSTVNRYMSAISILAKHTNVPLPLMPRMRNGPARQRVFTTDEIDLVIQTLTLWGRLRERDLFVFLVDTGARPYSEACRLRWEYLTEATATFVVTKNGRSRTIPLTPRALEAVQRQRDRASAKQEGPWTDITEWHMIDVWRSIRIHLPSLKGTVVYTARHTCASRQVAAGVDLLRVMKWMGHTNYQTTLGYAHLAPRHLHENLMALSIAGGQ